MTPTALNAVPSREQLLRLLRRIKPMLRRARNEGVLFLVLAVSFALVAAAATRLLQIESTQVMQHDQELFTKIFGVRQEERELPYPGVVAGLLGTINSEVGDVHCLADSPLRACRQKDAVLDTASRLFALALDTDVLPTDQVLAPGECGEGISGAVHNRLLTMWAGTSSDRSRRCAWLMSALQGISRVRTDKQDIALQPCPDGDDPVVAKSYGVGQAACEAFRRPGSPATLIPAQSTDFAVAERIRNHLRSKGSSAIDRWIPDWEGDAKEIAAVAQLIDIAIDNAMAVVADRATTAAGAGSLSLLENAELRQAYFISPDNFLRIWSLAGDPIKILPRTRLWSASAYLRPFLVGGSRSPVQTRAYFDIGGNGLVSTECRPLWLGQGRSSVFLGAVCVDLTLNISQNAELLRRIVSNRFLQIEPVAVSLQEGMTRVDSIDSAITLPHYDRKALATAIETLMRTSGIGELAQAVHSISIAGEAAFTVPIGSIGEKTVQVLIVSPAKSRGLGSRQSLLTGVQWLSLSGYLIFITIGMLKRREDEAVRNDLVIFRSLQTGVIETLISGEEIVRANDRAEELLGKALPKVRTVATNFRTIYTQQFDLALELEGDRWPDGSNAAPDSDDDAGASDPHRYKEVSGTVIYRRRSDGRTSRYWIHLRGRPAEDGWLLVQAGPLVRETGALLSEFLRRGENDAPRHEIKAVSTYGTMERCNGNRIPALAAAWTIWNSEREQKAESGVAAENTVVKRDATRGG